jgi:hypothetical protein
MVKIDELVCGIKGCQNKASHLCTKCKTIGYCCQDCANRDKKYHSVLCRRVTGTTKKSLKKKSSMKSLKKKSSMKSLKKKFKKSSKR